MVQLELELGQLIKRWRGDAQNILRTVDGLTDDYDTGYAHGIRQASDELSDFLWLRSCCEGADRVIDKTYRRRDGW